MTRTHRRHLIHAAAPAVLLAVLLTGCGTEGDGDADVRGEDVSQTPTPSESTTPTGRGSTSTGGVDFEQVAILHGSAEGGATSDSPVLLDSQEAVDGFVAGFSRGKLAEQVQKTYDATDVPEGKALVGSVISIGCDVPPGVLVSDTDGLKITPKKVASPLRECLAAVTSVALVLVDAEAVV